MPPLITQLLVAGACYDNDTIFQMCALQPRQCTRKEQIFRSSKWLSLNDSIRANECALLENIKNIPAMGRCDADSERYICTSHKTACRFSANFQPYDPDCTVVDDIKPDSFFEKSYFPRCEVVPMPSASPSEAPSPMSPNTPIQTPSDIPADDILEDFCVWQFNECPRTTVYQFDIADHFFAHSKPMCQCEDVKVGACVSSNSNEGYFCAVSKEVCGTEDGYSYLKAKEVESQLNITCKLCDKLPQSDNTDDKGTSGGNMPSETTEQASKTQSPSPQPTPLSTPINSQNVGIVLKQDEGEDGEGSSITALTILAIVIGIVAILILVIMIYNWDAKKKRAKKERMENSTDENIESKVESDVLEHGWC